MKIEEAHALFNSQYLGQWIVCPEFETSEKFRLDGITISDININDGKLITIPKYSLVITGDFFRGTCGFNQTGQCDMDASYIILRSVQDLTDEKLEIIAEHEGVLRPFTYKRESESVYIKGRKKTELFICNDFSISYFTYGGIECDYERPLLSETVNYLRLIGILTDFTYLSDDNKPVTLSPATLISMGWARVK